MRRTEERARREILRYLAGRKRYDDSVAVVRSSTVNAIARSLGLPRSGVQTLLEDMRREGLVDSRQDVRALSSSTAMWMCTPSGRETVGGGT